MTETMTARTEAAAERPEIVELARELARRELAPRALELDERRPGALDAAWRCVSEVGFDKGLLGVDDGGVGLDRGSLLLSLEEIAAGDGGVAMLVLLANAALAAMPAELAAQIGATERWALVPAASEQLPTGARVSVTAKHGDGVVLAGALSPALGALGADGVVLVTSAAEPAVVVLPADAAGLRIEASHPQLGLRAAAAARIELSAAAARTAPPGAAGDLLALLRAGSAAIARGIARRAHDMALAYARTRVQGGVAIVEHDAVRDMLGAMAVRLAATPSSLAAGAGEAAALVAKLAATDAAVATTTDAVQVFGGAGYMHETGIEKLMRDAKCLQLWPEPNWIARGRLWELRR